MLISIFEFSNDSEQEYFVYAIGACIMLGQYDALPSLVNNTFQSIAILLVLFLYQRIIAQRQQCNSQAHKQLLRQSYGCWYVYIVKIPYLNPSRIYEGILILMVFVLMWANDSFAYLIGKSIGKNKLFERISPNKTIEGFVGGVVATMTLSYFIGNQFDILSPTQWSIIGGLVSVFGVIGDLIASQYKVTKVKIQKNHTRSRGNY